MVSCSPTIPNILIFSHLRQTAASAIVAVMQAVTGVVSQAVACSGVSSPTIVQEQPPAQDASYTGIVVLDTSSSMGSTDWKPSRIGAAKEAAKAYVDEMRNSKPRAMIGIVGYGSRATLLCPLTAASDDDAIAAAIDAASARGTTNITDGLRVAAAMLASSHGSAQVVLLSDGHHNHEPGPDRLAADIRERATVECVGIGGSPKEVDEPLMKRVASTRPDGTKRYRWIGDKGQLIQHFRNLGGGITRA